MPQQHLTSLSPVRARWPVVIVAVVAVPVLGLLTLTACSTTPGSGSLKTEARQVSGFSMVELQGSGDVTIRQTGTESLTIQAEDNVLPTLTSKVAGGTLRLGAKPGTDIASTKPIHYRLTVKNLVGLHISGSGNISAPKINTETLSARISGSGNISIGGTTVDQSVHIAGSGNYTADALSSKGVSADISGSGHASILVSAALNLHISGSGNLTYSGDPQVHEEITGSGTLIKK